MGEYDVTLTGKVTIPDPPAGEPGLAYLDGLAATGQTMSALVRDQKLNSLATAFHAELRGGVLAGSLRIDSGKAKQIQQGILTVRFDGLIWKYGGLQTYLPGLAHFETQVEGRYRQGMARFAGGQLHFLFPLEFCKLVQFSVNGF